MDGLTERPTAKKRAEGFVSTFISTSKTIKKLHHERLLASVSVTRTVNVGIVVRRDRAQRRTR